MVEFAGVKIITITELPTCDGCGYKAPLKAWENPPNTFPDAKHSNLCAICAGTPCGSAWVYGPEQYPEQNTLKTIAYAANTMLDTLGLLWPTEDETAPTGVGPSVAEVERDALNIRAFELEEEITSLNQQADKAISQRDACLEKIQDDAREHENEMRVALDRIAKAEARAAVLDVSVPEDTTDPEETEDNASA